MIKYMGSKRALLRNGLGAVIGEESRDGRRVVDLFCGSGAVSWFAAVKLGKRVLACDLQEFAVVLAGAVLKRTRPVNQAVLESVWLKDAEAGRREYAAWDDAVRFERRRKKDEGWHRQAQMLCEAKYGNEEYLIFSRYGGHYFSPMQALSLDAMLDKLPEDRQLRSVCLAATIVAASRCAAAPGHTAQPFKSTVSGSKYLQEAWSRDTLREAAVGLQRIAPLHAKRCGTTLVGDANEIAGGLGSNDVVFVDPPYSAVQYSRFYHVLETVARGWCGDVGGVGRYPSREERPQSLYSRSAKSSAVIEELLEKLSNRGCKVVITFPVGKCSNGMSGEWIELTAKRFFEVSRRTVESRFSTLGGNSTIRDARKQAKELILVLRT
ncbi:MAG: adenine methyltransferase [Gammaproteobacteria bacterium]|nr:adenine methyltransferase [Gammaproteobacteria bacterium]